MQHEPLYAGRIGNAFSCRLTDDVFELFRMSLVRALVSGGLVCNYGRRQWDAEFYQCIARESSWSVG